MGDYKTASKHRWAGFDEDGGQTVFANQNGNGR